MVIVSARYASGVVCRLFMTHYAKAHPIEYEYCISCHCDGNNDIPRAHIAWHHYINHDPCRASMPLLACLASAQVGVACQKYFAPCFFLLYRNTLSTNEETRSIRFAKVPYDLFLREQNTELYRRPLKLPRFRFLFASSL